MRVLIVSADGFEDSELQVPYSRLREEDIRVDAASFIRGPIPGKHGARVDADLALADVRAFCGAGKPVAAICHAPEGLIAAGVLSGRAATCYRTVSPELAGAGARYRDAEVVVDANLVTSKLLRARAAASPRP